MTGPHVSRRIGALLRPDARFVERVEGRRRTWEGTIFSADVLTVGLPDGTQGRREVAVHHGGPAPAWWPTARCASSASIASRWGA